MNPKHNANFDVQVVAMMVAKLLRTEHGIDEVPLAEEYEILEENIRINRSTDIRVSIKLDRGIAVAVTQHWWIKEELDLEDVVKAASGVADSIAAVHDERHNIIAMTKEVRTAASREIAKARRRGLQYRLISATPFMFEETFRNGFAVDVVYERLAETLRLEPASFQACDADDVIDTFGRNREEQEIRAICSTWLRLEGASGRIDCVVVNALREAGHDIPETLKLLTNSVANVVKVGDDAAGGRPFRLHWTNGDVYAHLTVGDGMTWHQGILTFQNAPVPLTKVKGKRLRDVLHNPLFGEVRILSGSGRKGEQVSLYCTPELLNFNADTGQLWAG